MCFLIRHMFLKQGEKKEREAWTLLQQSLVSHLRRECVTEGIDISSSWEQNIRKWQHFKGEIRTFCKGSRS